MSFWFYVGFMIMTIGGHFLAMRVGGTRAFGSSVLLTSLLSIFTPPLTWLGSGTMMIVVRGLEGLIQVSQSSVEPV